MAAVLGRLWTMLTRILLLLFGLALFFGVMFVGILATIGVTVWALIRGRRLVPLDFGWKGPVDWRAGARRSSSRQSAEADIVDTEARVIDSPTPRVAHRDDPPG